MEQRLAIKGLHTSNNELSSVPVGALDVAKNIDILSENIAQPRRGFDLATTSGYSSSSDRTDKTFFYQDKLFSHHGTYGSASTLSYFNSGWNSVSSYSAPSGYKMRTLEANQNLYFTTSTGVKKLDVFSGTPSSSGVPKSLNMETALVSGSVNWLAGIAGTNTVAYRCVWARYDLNNNLVIGAPSGRIYASNSLGSGNDRAVELTVYIPDDITTDYFCQIYRSAVTDAATPSDELQLVYEVFPTSTDITNGYLATITDITPESLRGAALYTNATQEGLAFQNDQPPLAKDIAVFRDSTFYANTTSKHRYYLTLISASSMSNDDTLSIGGITYTAKASETIASGYFKLFTAGSASQNIADTATSLVNVINQYASSTVYSYYLSSGDDLPGKMLMEERSIGGAAFVITASVGTYWSPTGIPTSGTTETSTNDNYVNGLSWSKTGQPEHTPIVNSARIGSEDAAILRIVGLKDSLIIFKSDGIFRLTGYYPSFDVELLDSSAKLIGSETPSILNNEIYCLTDLGIIRISDSVEIISLSINQELIEIINKNTSLISTTSFGQGYETDKKYYLFLPETSADLSPNFAYVYNIFTNSFVKHFLDATAATVYDKTLYFGNGSSNYIWKERKNYTYLDFADYGFTSSISSISTTTIGISSGVDNIEAGDIIHQSDTIFGTVQSTDNIASTVVVDQDPGFTVAACDILTAIDTEIKWTAFVSPSPGAVKKFHECHLFFQESFNGTGYIHFSTDMSPAETSVELTGEEVGNWGLFLWGEAPWGGISFPRSWRQWVPRDKQRCKQMNVSFKHAWGYAPWKLTGILLVGTEGSSKGRRD